MTELKNNTLQRAEAIPDDWEFSTLGEILPLVYGKSLTKAKRDPAGPYSVFGSSGEVGRHSEAKTSGPSLIVGRKGSVGKIYYSSEPCWPIDTVYFAESQDGLNLKYMEYFLKGLQLEQLDKSTAVPGLSRDDYNSVEVAIAPRDQQDRIVAEIKKQFSRLDKAVASLKRVKANLKRYKAAVLKAAVEGKLTEEWRKQNPDVEPASKLLERILAERRSKWEEVELAKMKAKGKELKNDKWKEKYKEPTACLESDDSGVLPKGWASCSSNLLFAFVTSGSRGWAKYYSEEGAIFLRMGNLDHDTIELDLVEIQHVQPPANSEGTRTRVQANDLLISITADVGMVGLVPEGLGEAYINQHVALARPITMVNPLFLASYFVSQAAKNQLRRLQKGATKTGLGLNDIRNVYVAVPPLQEQNQIVSAVDVALSQIDNLFVELKKQETRIASVRSAVLREAFAGALIKVNDVIVSKEVYA